MKNSSLILSGINSSILKEILEMYSSGEISAGKVAGMLGIPRAAFYGILAKRKIPLPKKLSESILKELRELDISI